jgi:hypothetical protein
MPIDGSDGNRQDCPNCGYTPQLAEDDLIVRGECPACGIVVAKYLRMREVATASPPPFPLSRPLGGGVPESTTSTGEPSMEDVQSGAHEDSFWLVAVWGTVLTSLLGGCIPPLILLKNHFQSIPAPSEALTSAGGGLIAATLIALIMIASLFAYRICSTRRGLILMYALFTGGGILLLALVGGIVYFFLDVIRSFVVGAGLDRSISFQKATGLATALFLVISAVAFYVEPPGNPTRAAAPETLLGLGGSAQVLKDNVPDPVEYGDAVESAKDHYGAEFPAGGRKGQYRYFRDVYVKPARQLKPDFDATVRTLLNNGQVLLASNYPESAEVRLMFFNTVLFRTSLQRDRLILQETADQLRSVAGTWGYSDWVEDGDPGFKERVAKFDSHGPFAKADSIPKAVRRRGLPPEALSPPVRRTVRPPAREF